MPCRHQFSITAWRHLRARSVVAVERAAREIEIELRAVGGELLPEAVEDLDRQAARIGWCLHHDRRHGADEHQLGDTALAVARDIVRRLAAAGRMANVDGVAQVEMRDDRGDVRGVVVHVVTLADLARPAMAAPVMGNDAIPLLHEVEHLGVPVVGAQRPAMMEDEGLRVLGAPVLVVELDVVGVLSADLDIRHWNAPSRTCLDVLDDRNLFLVCLAPGASTPV